MEILQESDNSIYLKFISRDKQFKLADQECKFKYMQLDLDTLQTGWGRYESGYEFVCDTVVGAKTERPEGSYVLKGDQKKMFKRFCGKWMASRIMRRESLRSDNEVTEKSVIKTR